MAGGFLRENEGIAHGTVRPANVDKVEQSHPLVLARRRIMKILVAAVGTLTLLSIVGQVAKFQFGRPTLLGFVPLSYVDLENNLPTWYQTLAFAFAAGLLVILGTIMRRQRAPFARHWLALAALFVFFSIDEAGSLHERTMEPLMRITGPLPHIWQASWVILGMAAVVVVAIAFFRFFLHLPPRDRSQVLTAAALFVGGALIAETIPGIFYETSNPAYKETLLYVVSVHVEEVLEMTGLLVFIDFVLRRLSGSARWSLAIEESK